MKQERQLIEFVCKECKKALTVFRNPSGMPREYCEDCIQYRRYKQRKEYYSKNKWRFNKK